MRPASARDAAPGDEDATAPARTHPHGDPGGRRGPGPAVRARPRRDHPQLLGALRAPAPARPDAHVRAVDPAQPPAARAPGAHRGPAAHRPPRTGDAVPAGRRHGLLPAADRRPRRHGRLHRRPGAGREPAPRRPLPGRRLERGTRRHLRRRHRDRDRPGADGAPGRPLRRHPHPADLHHLAGVRPAGPADGGARHLGAELAAQQGQPASGAAAGEDVRRSDRERQLPAALPARLDPAAERVRRVRRRQPALPAGAGRRRAGDRPQPRRAATAGGRGRRRAGAGAALRAAVRRALRGDGPLRAVPPLGPAGADGGRQLPADVHAGLAAGAAAPDDATAGSPGRAPVAGAAGRVVGRRPGAGPPARARRAAGQCLARRAADR